MTIEYFKVSTSEPVIAYLTLHISQPLAEGKKVLWLLSGGSYIETQVETAKKLAHLDLSNLTVSLTDERFGPPGHKDSNWQKLLATGFSLPGANLVPVLKGKDFTETTLEFSDFIKSSFEKNDYKIACVGVGADGHTLGVLVNSPGVDSPELVVGYEGKDFKRITLSLRSLEWLDEVLVYMFGQQKQALISQIAKQNLPSRRQPAQALKKSKRLIVYNDYIGTEV